MYNIVIAGSTDFTVDCIKEVMKMSNVNIAAIITTIDTKKDRKGNIVISPISEFALNNHIPLFRPENVNDKEFHKKLYELNIDFFLVVAYGKILSPDTLAIAKIMSLNVHGSLLPELRGACPVEYAILQGLTTTGTTLQKMSAKLDEGDIVLQHSIKIKPEWNHHELYEEIKKSGCIVLEEFFKDPEEYLSRAIVQDKRKATYCSKIKKEDGAIDFTKKARDIHNKVRAFNDWPVAYCKHADTTLRIFKTKVIDENRLANKDYGSVYQVLEDELLIQTGSGLLSIIEIQREGKKIQGIKDFLKGYRIKKGDSLY